MGRFIYILITAICIGFIAWHLVAKFSGDDANRYRYYGEPQPKR